MKTAFLSLFILSTISFALPVMADDGTETPCTAVTEEMVREVVPGTPAAGTQTTADDA